MERQFSVCTRATNVLPSTVEPLRCDDTSHAMCVRHSVAKIKVRRGSHSGERENRESGVHYAYVAAIIRGMIVLLSESCRGSLQDTRRPSRNGITRISDFIRDDICDDAGYLLAFFTFFPFRGIRVNLCRKRRNGAPYIMRCASVNRGLRRLRVSLGGRESKSCHLDSR